MPHPPAQGLPTIAVAESFEKAEQVQVVQASRGTRVRKEHLEGKPFSEGEHTP